MKKFTAAWFMAILIALSAMATGAAMAAPFQNGDVFAAVNNGNVQHFNSAGVLIETLNTGLGGFTTGMAFDSAQNLYVTDFTAGAVSEFNNNGILLGTFGSGFTGNCPESILFDAGGNAYVGQACGTTHIRKFDSAGNFLTEYAVQTEVIGSDWIDLLPDQCTIHYTSEGSHIKAFDVCGNVQLSDFSSLGHGKAFAHRLMKDGTTLVADSSEVLRVDAAGNIIQHYTTGGLVELFALNLDPDGSSFWTGDDGTGLFYKFDIATGNLLMTVDTGKGGGNLFGLIVFGEQTAATGSISGMKFDDVNGNGVKDPGDTGLSGWTIQLKDGTGALIASTATALDGTYSFSSLRADTYTVSEVHQTGWSQTAPSTGFYTVPIAAGDHITGKDFGNKGGGVTVPEFPTALIPATFIFGFVLLVLLVRKR